MLSWPFRPRKCLNAILLFSRVENGGGPYPRREVSRSVAVNQTLVMQHQSCREPANQLQVTLGAVKTLIHRLRKQYAYLLRQEVARTVSDPTEVDEEIHSLCNALIASEGHLEHENTD